MVWGIVAAVIAVVASAGVYYQQKKMEAQAKKQANEAKAVQISGHDSNRGLYTVYGEALVGSTIVWKAVTDKEARITQSGFTTFSAATGTSLTTNKDHKNNRWLYRAVTLCNGPVTQITNVTIDDEGYNSARFTNKTTKHFATSVSLGPAAGQNFSSLRNAYADFNTWGSDAVGKGVAYAMERLYLHKDKPAYQGEPQTRYKVNGRALYDPRKDSTSSVYDSGLGVSSHRATTSSTWEYSDNPVLALLDYMRSEEYGRGLDISVIDLASIAASADKCDVLVDVPQVLSNDTGSTVTYYDPETGEVFTVPMSGILPYYRPGQDTTGSFANKQKRFRINMAVDPAKEILDNIQEILNVFRGNLSYANGKYLVHMADVATPVLTLGDDDIIGGLKIAHGDRSQRMNRATVKFINSNKQHKTDQVSWPSLDSNEDGGLYATYLAEDEDEKLHRTFTVKGCTDYYQAQDTAEFLVRESRSNLTVSGNFGSRCFGLVPGDVVELSYDSSGFSGKYFRVIQTQVNLVSMNVGLQLKEYDSSVYTWNTNRGNEPLGLSWQEEVVNADPTNLTIGTIVTNTRTRADGSSALTLTVPFSDVPEAAQYVEISWAINNTNDYNTQLVFDTENQTQTEVAIERDGETYAVRARYFATNSYGTLMPSAYTETTHAVADLSGTKLDGIEDGATQNTGDLADLDTVSANEIDDEAVTIAKLDTSLESTNYQAGVSGWKLTKAGAFEAGSGTFRGDVTATSITLESGVTLGSSDLDQTTQDSLALADSALQDEDTSVNLGLTDGSVGGITINATSVESTNFSSGTSGFKLESDGTFEVGDGTFRGGITATSITLEGTTIAGNQLDQSTQDSLGLADSAIQDEDTGLDLGITAGTIAGVTINSTTLYQGTGTFNNSNTGFYLDNQGQFSLKDKLSFNGTDLSVSGSVTASAFTLSSGATLTDTDDLIANTNNNAFFRFETTAANDAVAAPTNTEFSAAFGRNPRTRDVVIVVNTVSNPDVSAAYVYNGSSWDAENDFITGDVIVDGTIKAANIDVNDLITSGSLLTGSATISNDIRIGSGQSVFSADSNGIYLGSTGFSQAEFRVTPEGALTATGVNLTGEMTANDGSVGGISIGSDKLYAGNGDWSNSNTGFYLDNTGKFSLKDKLFFDPTNNTLTVDGNITADVITAKQNLVVLGDLQASSVATGSITRAMLSQDALDEIFGSLASSVGGSNGDFKDGSGTFTTSGGSVTLGTSSDKFDHGVSDVDVEFNINTFFYSTTNYTQAQAQATLTFEATADGTFNDLNSADKTHTLQFFEYDLSSYYGYTYLVYHLNTAITKTFTSGSGSDLTDNVDLQFRVSASSVGSAFTGQTIAFDVAANEGVTGVTSTGGNADTLDNLDSTAFLRSNVDDTFDGTLTITGDLVLQGEIDQYNVNNLDVTDKTITVNNGGTQALSDGAGLIVDRGTAADASITWAETGDKFQISHPVILAGRNSDSGSSNGYVTSGTKLHDALTNVALELHSGSDESPATIYFKSGVNAPSDFAYISYFPDYNNVGENGVLVIGSENDGSGSSDNIRLQGRVIVDNDNFTSDNGKIMEWYAGTSQKGSIDASGNLQADGTVTWLGGSSTNANAAHSWGDHSAAGYLTAEADTLASVTGRGATTTVDMQVAHLGVDGAANATYPLYVHGSIAQGSGSIYSFGDVIIGMGGLKKGTTTLIDSNRNLQNIASFDTDIKVPRDHKLLFEEGAANTYTNIIKSGNYPSQGYTGTATYWLEYAAKGGHNFIVNTDGGENASENAYDHFTVWQGAVDGRKLFHVTNSNGDVHSRGSLNAGGVVTGTGLGINEDSPLSPVHVTVTSSQTALTLQNTAGGTGANVGLDFITYNDISGYANPGARISAVDDGSHGADLTFYGKASGIAGALSTIMTVKAKGDVEVNSGDLDVISGALQLGGTTAIASTRRFYASNGTTVKAAYSFDGDSGTGISRTSAGRLDFLSSGVVKAYIRTGTTNPISDTMYVDGQLGVNGKVVWSGGSSTNANTAYSWGNHASAGYLVSGGNAAFGTISANNNSSLVLKGNNVYGVKVEHDYTGSSVNGDALSLRRTSTTGSKRIQIGLITNDSDGLHHRGHIYAERDTVDYGGKVVIRVRSSSSGYDDAIIARYNGDVEFPSGDLKVGSQTFIDSGRNLLNIANSTSTGLISNIRTSAFSPNDSSAGLRLEYSGGDATNEIGSGIVFAQRWYNQSTNNVRTGGIAGYKGAGSGAFGGGLKFYTQPQSGSNMNLALTLDKDKHATFAANVGVAGAANATYPLYVHGSIAQGSGSIFSFGDIVVGIGALKKGTTTWISASGVLQNVTADANIITSGTIAEARLPTQTKYLRSDTSDTMTFNTTSAEMLKFANNTSGGLIQLGFQQNDTDGMHHRLYLKTFKSSAGTAAGPVQFIVRGAGGSLTSDILELEAGQRASWQGNDIFTDAYHPNADKLTTARTLTLSGDVTGSASFDGSANATITTAVANNSHNHTYSIVSGISDLNSVPDAHIERFRPFVSDFQASNRSGSNYNGGFEVGTRATGYSSQFVFEAGGATSPPKFRNKVSGTWGSWQTVLTANAAVDTQVAHLGVDGAPNASYPLYVYGHIAQASGSIFSFGDVVIGNGGLKRGSTTLIDPALNLTNITSISSGVTTISGSAPDTTGVLTVSNTKSGGIYYPAARFVNNNSNHSYGIVAEFRTQGTGSDRPSILFTNDDSNHTWQVGPGTSPSGVLDDFVIGYRNVADPDDFGAWPTALLTINHTSGDATFAGDITTAGSITSTGTFTSTNLAATGSVSGGQFRASFGSMSAPAYTFKNDDDTGFYGAAGTVYGVTGGAKRLTLNASGVSAHNDLSILTGKLKMGTIDVIDSSRNLKNITNLSSTINGNNPSGGNIVLGATGNNATKWTAITSRQYNNSTETEGYSLVTGATNAGANHVSIGGGLDEQNAATHVYIKAAANTSTRNGTEVVRVTTDGFDIRNNVLRITGPTVIDSDRNAATADITLTSGTSGTNTKGLVFKTTDNVDENAYIRKNAYYMQLNANNNEGFHFTGTGSTSLLRIHGSTNGIRPQSVDITADNGLYMNNQQVMTAARALTNIASVSVSSSVTASTVQATANSDGTGLMMRGSTEVLSGEGWCTGLYNYNVNDGFLVLRRNSSGTAYPHFHVSGYNNPGYAGYTDGDGMVTLTRSTHTKSQGTPYAGSALSAGTDYSRWVKTSTETILHDNDSQHRMTGRLTVNHPSAVTNFALYVGGHIAQASGSIYSFGDVVIGNGGLKRGTTTLIDPSRVLQNVTLGHGTAGSRFQVDDWMWDSGSRRRFYFENTGRTFFGSGGGYIFRDSSDVGRATISNDGGLNLRSGGDGTVGSTVALAVSGNTAIDSSRTFFAGTKGYNTTATGNTSTTASTAIKQTYSEGWTAIYADFEPYHEWGIYHDNPSNDFYITAGSSTNNLGSFTVVNHTGNNRTAYKKIKFDQDTGEIRAGGGYYVGNTEVINTNRDILNLNSIQMPNRNGAVTMSAYDGAIHLRSFTDKYHKIWYYDGIAFATNEGHGHFRFYAESNTQRNATSPGKTLVFDIDSQNQTVTASGNITAYSDIKLKDDIKPIESALEKVCAIRGVTYTRKDHQDKTKRHMGVIAQEVEAAGLGEVVEYNEEKDVKTVSYGSMVGALVEAIKEQQQQIDLLKNIIEEMKNGNN